MSRQFIEAFFPASASLLQSAPWIENISSTLYPRETQCPEIVVSVMGDATIRNPVLCFHATFGILLGVGGGVCILQQQQYRLTRNKRTDALLLFWPEAFLCFGFMNVAALFLHCLLPTSLENNYSTHSPWLWIADNYFTGASSIAIVLAIIHRARNGGGVKGPSLRFVQIMLYSGVGLLGAVGCFLRDPTMTLPLELWYLLPTNTAGLVVWVYLAHQTIHNKNNAAAVLTLWSCSLAGLVGVGGILLDSLLCQWLGQAWWLDTFTAPTLVFFSCNCAFLSLFCFIMRGGQVHKMH